MSFSIRIPSLQRNVLYLSWVILAITGLYFAYTLDWKMQDPSDLTVDALKTHGITAALFLVLFGSLLAVHIKLALKMKRNLITGLVMLSLMSCLAISGTGLYYSPENWHENVKWAHIWIGIISILWLPLHIFIGIYQRKNK
jgi:cell division protein FtsW (lipid II flippase)